MIADLLFYVDVPKYLESDILRLAIETEHLSLIKVYMSMFEIKHKHQALALLSIANLDNMTYYLVVRELNNMFEAKHGRRY